MAMRSAPDCRRFPYSDTRILWPVAASLGWRSVFLKLGFAGGVTPQQLGQVLREG